MRIWQNNITNYEDTIAGSYYLAFRCSSAKCSLLRWFNYSNYKQLLSSSPIAAMLREGDATKSPLAGTSTLLNHNLRTSLRRTGHLKTSYIWWEKNMVFRFRFSLKPIHWMGQFSDITSLPRGGRACGGRGARLPKGCPSLVWWHYSTVKNGLVLQESHIFHGKIYGFRLRFSLKPIYWTVSI